jgi:DNA-binding NtrC family response regulator
LKPSVLIFENSDILRSTLSSIISNLEYEVKAFSNPGMSPYSYSSIHNCLFENCSPNIIISDVYLPLINEYDVLGYRLQKVDELIFMAFMPADWNEVDIYHTEKIGCKVFKKPFDLKDMLKWLDNCRKQIDQKNILFNKFNRRDRL